MSLEYLIDCPAYATNSAGIRAMHYLAALLHRAGITIWSTVPNNFEKLPITHLTTAENLVAIYPDCVGPENKYRCSRVVRFMCAPASWPRPGFFGGGRISKEDMVFLFDDWYLNDVAAHYDGTLWKDCVFPLPCIEPEIFYPEEKTLNTALYVGKYDGPISFAASVILTRGSHTREDAAAILRRTERFYTLDHYTMMAHEAALCGCEVLKLFPDGTSQEYPTSPHQYLMMTECDDWIAGNFDAMVRRHFSPGRTSQGHGQSALQSAPAHMA